MNIQWDQEEIISSALTKLKNDLFHDGKWYADYVRLRCRAVKKCFKNA